MKIKILNEQDEPIFEGDITTEELTQPATLIKRLKKFKALKVTVAKIVFNEPVSVVNMQEELTPDKVKGIVLKGKLK